MTATSSVPVELDPSRGESWLHGSPVLMLSRVEMARLQGAVAGGPGEAAWQAAAREAAREWCREEARATGADAVTVVGRYLDSLAQRGWGHFELLYCRPEDCGAGVRVYNSPFAATPGARPPACRTFLAWLEGAMGWACPDPDYAPVAEERCCAAGGAEACEFVVRPSVTSDDD